MCIRDRPYGAPQQPGQPYGAAPQQPGQPYYQPGQPVQPYVSPSNGKAIGALVCGILAILFSWLPLLGVILGVVAIVLAVQAVKRSGKDSKATGGKICGIVGIVLSVIAFVFWLVVSITAVAALNEYENSRDSLTANPPIEVPAPGANSSDATQEADEEAAKAAVDQALSALKSMSDTDMQEISDALDEGFTEGSGFSMTELGVDPMTFAEWLMGDLDYTIEDAFITGDTGWVDVTATVRDVYAFSLVFNDEIDA